MMYTVILGVYAPNLGLDVELLCPGFETFEEAQQVMKALRQVLGGSSVPMGFMRTLSFEIAS